MKCDDDLKITIAIGENNPGGVFAIKTLWLTKEFIEDSPMCVLEEILAVACREVLRKKVRE